MDVFRPGAPRADKLNLGVGCGPPVAEINIRFVGVESCQKGAISGRADVQCDISLVLINNEDKQERRGKTKHKSYLAPVLTNELSSFLWVHLGGSCPFAHSISMVVVPGARVEM